MEHDDLVVVLNGHEGGDVDDLAGLLGGDRRAGAQDLVDVGMLAAQRQPRRAQARIVDLREQQRSEGTCRFVLRRARWADEQVRVHGRHDSRTKPADGGWLADDVVPDARHGAPPSEARTRAATVSGSPVASMTRHRCGSAAAIAR